MAASGNPGRKDTDHLKLCWSLAVIWLGIFLVSLLQQGSSTAAYWSAAQALILVVFVVVHGWLSYGWKGFGAYVLIAAVVSFLLEASSIATGFPFGYYVHHQPGPKPLGVPIPVVFGYVILGWLAWTLARVIARDAPSNPGGQNRFTTPLIASFILAGYDFSYDAIGSTVLNMWTYRDPGGHFGVPLKNYLGWLFTGWLYFQLFALIEDRFHPKAASMRKSFWLLPCLIWLVMALQYPAMFAAASSAMVERGGDTFDVAHIYEAAVAGSLFTMVFVSLVAMVRLQSMRGGAALPEGRN